MATPIIFHTIFVFIKCIFRKLQKYQNIIISLSWAKSELVGSLQKRVINLQLNAIKNSFFGSSLVFK